MEKQFVRNRTEGSFGQSFPLNFQKYTLLLKTALWLTQHLPGPKPLTVQALGRGVVGVEANCPSASTIAGCDSAHGEHTCLVSTPLTGCCFNVARAHGADRAVKKGEVLSL